MSQHPEPIGGIAASRLQLPRGAWSTVLECLCAHFPSIDEAQWRDRMRRGLVLDADGVRVDASSAYRVGAVIRYYREVIDEAVIEAQELIVHADAHLIVVDKPHFLTVMPAGRYASDTLLARLIRRLGQRDLVPLHRIDRETAGLVMFSAHRDSRAQYSALFAKHRIEKRYQAIAAPLPDQSLPRLHRSLMVAGEPFFRMQEVAGNPNSTSHIDVLERGESWWRYALSPITGKKHQLRVHMAALGAPIRNDRLYPQLVESIGDEIDQPLQLLARSLAFVDPLDGSQRQFVSTRTLELGNLGTSPEPRSPPELGIL